MKTTLDLPEDLVRELKLRALRDGRRLKDAAAAALRAGLAAQEAHASAEKPAGISKDRKTGLPVIQSPRRARPHEALTPQRVAQILAAQEAGWARDSG